MIKRGATALLLAAAVWAGAAGAVDSATGAATEAEWRPRWGVLIDMIGKPWITGVVGQPLELARTIAGSGNYATYTWAIPGEVLLVHQHNANEQKLARRIRWDAESGTLIEEDTSMPGVETVHRVQPDGSLAYTLPTIPDAHGSYRMRSDGAVETHFQRTMPTGPVHLSFVYIEMTPASQTERLAYVQALARVEAEAKADAARQAALADEQRSARWSAAMGALNGALDAGLEVARAQEADSRYKLDATLSDINSRIAAERARTHASASSTNASVARQPQPPAPSTAMRSPEMQLPAQPALPAGGTGSWETSGGRSPSPSAAGQASTRDDARTCVSAPVTSRHRCDTLVGYKGMVSSSCSVPVDVKMCFMTATGWNCQVRNGLGPQQTWEPGWCHANSGQVFHSVRYSDSREPLASP